MEMVRCLVSDALLHERFSAEAASYVVYTLNNTPHISIEFLIW